MEGGGVGGDGAAFGVVAAAPVDLLDEVGEVRLNRDVVLVGDQLVRVPDGVAAGRRDLQDDAVDGQEEAEAEGGDVAVDVDVVLVAQLLLVGQPRGLAPDVGREAAGVEEADLAAGHLLAQVPARDPGVHVVRVAPGQLVQVQALVRVHGDAAARGLAPPDRHVPLAGPGHGSQGVVVERAAVRWQDAARRQLPVVLVGNRQVRVARRRARTQHRNHGSRERRRRLVADNVQVGMRAVVRHGREVASIQHEVAVREAMRGRRLLQHVPEVVHAPLRVRPRQQGPEQAVVRGPARRVEVEALRVAGDALFPALVLPHVQVNAPVVAEAQVGQMPIFHDPPLSHAHVDADGQGLEVVPKGPHHRLPLRSWPQPPMHRRPRRPGRLEVAWRVVHALSQRCPVVGPQVRVQLIGRRNRGETSDPLATRRRRPRPLRSLRSSRPRGL